MVYFGRDKEPQGFRRGVILVTFVSRDAESLINIRSFFIPPVSFVRINLERPARRDGYAKPTSVGTTFSPPHTFL